MSSWLQKQVNERPDQPAFYWQDETWSFAEVGQEVKQWADTFSMKIPSKEKRIGLFSRNSKEMYFSILALWALGKELVLLNTQLSIQELRYQLTDAKVNQVVVATESLSFFAKLDFLTVTEMIQPETNLLSTSETTPAYNLDATASIMYTSGTTGNPKGVVQCFSNHLSSALATQENMKITEADCWLCPVPLFHISGLSIIIRQLVLGCSLRLYSKFEAKAVTEDLADGQGTVISVVAVMLRELLEHYPKNGYRSTFKAMLLGGGPISPKALEKCESYGIPVIQSYGMTETCSQVVALSFEDAAKKIGSAGKPLMGIALKIVDTNEKQLEPNNVGEILLKGKNVVRHYLNGEQWQTVKWTPDGWFKTGDMGYLDEDGYLYLVSRLSELIISGGENIYPTEIEHVLQEFPGVKEVAVVGEPDEKWDAVPVAYIVGAPTITAEMINAFAKQYLAKYKLPKRVYLCHSLPKTASGKLAKHRLTTIEREAFLNK
ncbi:O-succinylbenzoate-CoA ligase [Enterococcus sp. 7E2_DIV0204]|uniref:o-succinylbenzoate--CoA ligase n=1 Tax=unclassified Enterococcus TaxID=2608891 RepID=UPI000A33D2E7|nr:MULTISPECIES: o-succinylbenzoate--CoA ligase [unclassified Enterococcus]OTN88788.1 O-succinylbenzoate-CoA ligase [Enterococcus sp. 7E2_DIV0204]OTP51252.1 O-succinylbenzoate-CoA ligase [Enterococcus sp. 7D2_DIV0200]